MGGKYTSGAARFCSFSWQRPSFSTASRQQPTPSIPAAPSTSSPACSAPAGATRALAALLHGNLVAALRQNALFVCLLPFAGLYLLSALHGRNWPRLPAPLLASIFVAAAVFTVARNLL
jgi:hypothetical protein